MSLKRLFLRSREDEELSEELESHLAHEMQDNLARGMSPEAARRQAYLKLGNPLVIRDRVWEANRVAWIEDAWRDLRYAARILAKAPGFTCVAVLVMALGIGANTAIYSFLDSLLLRSLPVSDPASLVVINWHLRNERSDNVMQSMSGSTFDDDRLGVVGGIFPYPAFERLQKNTAVFSDLFAYAHTREVRTLSLSVEGQGETASASAIAKSYPLVRG